MKNKVFLFLIFIPLTVTATNFEVSWDKYPVPEATIVVSCGINAAKKTTVGSVPATTNTLAFTLDAQAYNTVACVTHATLNGAVSEPSNVTTYRMPGCTLV